MDNREKRAIGLIGAKFGTRTVVDCYLKVRQYKNIRKSDWYYNLLCDCGHKSSLKKDDLKSNCLGCYIPANKIHGLAKKNNKTYNIWKTMRQRVMNPNCYDYKYYGARGIKICDRWNDFLNFYADMGDKPAGKSLDRINNQGDYNPENCKWSTQKEQVRNSRKCLK